MKVFVYGTLKRGYRNNFLLEDSKFVGDGETVAECRLFDVGFPILRRKSDDHFLHNAPVVGEVYECSDATIEQLDRLESEGRMYDRRVKLIKLVDGRVVKASAYVGRSEFWRRRRPYMLTPEKGKYIWPQSTKRSGIGEQHD